MARLCPVTQMPWEEMRMFGVVRGTYWGHRWEDLLVGFVSPAVNQPIKYYWTPLLCQNIWFFCLNGASRLRGKAIIISTLAIIKTKTEAIANIYDEPTLGQLLC